MKQVDDQLERYFQLSLEMLCILGLDGRFKRVNPAFCRAMGYSAEELLARPLADFVFAEDRESTQAACERLGLGEDIMEFAHRVVHKDGEVRWLSWNAVADLEKNQAHAVVRDKTEAIEHEKAEKLTLERLHWAQKISKLGYWEFNFRSEKFFWSPETCRIYGLDPAMSEGTFKDFKNTTHPEDWSQVKATIENALLTGGEYDLDHRVLYPDGTTRIVNDLGAAIYDKDGNPERFLGVSVDITERKDVERRLRYSQEIFSGILDNATDAIISMDQNQCITIFNQGAENIFGYTLEEVKGRPMEILLPGPYRETHRHLVEEFGEGKEISFSMKARDTIYGLKKSGALFPAEASISKLKVSDGITYTVFLRDVSERKKAEQTLQLSEERYKALVEGSIQGLIISREMKPLFVNQTFADMVGFGSPDEVCALDSLADLIASEDLEKLVDQGMEIMTAPEPLKAHTLMKAKKRDGKWVVLDTYSRWIDWEGELALQSTVVDVTERSLLEEQLRQSQKMEAVGMLAGGVAHDFNNMLQIIHGHVEIALVKKDKPEAVVNSLERVLKATEGASSLTHQLLTFSRKQVLQTRKLDMNDLIGNLTKMMQRSLGENITLDMKPGHDLMVVLGDKGMMEQVVLNLCINARDAMPNGGRLTLLTENYWMDETFPNTHGWGKPGPWIRVSISDTGTGMSQEVREHLFEPFFTTKAAGKGTGLGLSTVYGITQQHEGHIEVFSELEVGTTFRFYLPALENETLEKTADNKAHVAQGGNETILVAEDNAEVLALTMELLTAQGYKVLTATDGLEAVELYKERQGEINMVILDMVMPRMSGREAFEIIRRNNAHVPVMFLTGYEAQNLDNEFLEREIFRLMHKPYSPTQLYVAVREELDRWATVNKQAQVS